MKNKFSLLTLFAAASLAGTPLFADNENYANHNLYGWDFSNQHLSFSNFYCANLINAKFVNAILTNANFSGANSRVRTNLTNANLKNADLSNASFALATLDGTDFTNSIITGASFQGAYSLTNEQIYSTRSYQERNLEGVDFGYFYAPNLNFYGQNLNNSVFNRASIHESNFDNANLTNAVFMRANLSGTTFFDAIITGASFVDTTGRGFTKEQLYSTKSYQDCCLKGIDFRYNDLSTWDFSKKDVTNSDLSDVKATKTNFVEANLTNVDFQSAILKDADFTNAIIKGANFNSVSDFTANQLYSTASYQDGDLAGISLGNNTLSGWNFRNQYLAGANFSSSTLNGTDFRGAIGLDLMWYSDMMAFSDYSINGTNVILADGTIGNFDVAAGTSFRIEAHEISAKLNDSGVISANGNMELVGGMLEINGTLTNYGNISITAQTGGKNAQIVIKNEAAFTNAGTILIYAGTLAENASVTIFANAGGDAVVVNEGTIKTFGGTYADGVFTAGTKNNVAAGSPLNVEVSLGTSIIITDYKRETEDGIKHAVSLSASAAIVIESVTNLDIAEIVLGETTYEIGASWDFDFAKKDEDTEVLVTMQIGSGLSSDLIKIFHREDDENAAWTDYTDKVGDVAYDSATGMLSFTAKDFSSYAATGKHSSIAIPEPSMFGLLAGLGALALVASQRRRKYKYTAQN